jgi:IgGFc binding protein
MNRSMVIVCLLVVGCGPSVNRPESGDPDGSVDAAEIVCGAGEQRCDGNVLEVCADNAFVPSETCEHACSSLHGCVLCVPNSSSCEGEVATTCSSDGGSVFQTACDPLQGMSCDIESGTCTGACSPDSLGTSYIGCDYFPTVTGNVVDATLHFAVAVANTRSEPATVTVDSGPLPSPMTFTVAPGSVAVQILPWHLGLKLANGLSATPGLQATDGAYHLRSTLPVTVYQFSPLEYVDASGNYSYTNDASLLLPTNVWNDDYLVASFAPLGSGPSSMPSLIAVTAAEDDTSVTLTTTAATTGSLTAPAFVAGVPQTVNLDAGDVLEIAAFGGDDSGDLTGTSVVSDRPVQVISGHVCANVPADTPYCDHLEESMFPIATLSDDYIVTAPSVPSIPDGKAEVVRIIATQPDTTLTYDPPQAGAPETIATAGSFVEIALPAADYRISANHKIVVVQYMEGQEAGGGTGDPAMTLAVPIDQYRTDYLFHAPTNYETNYVNVTAPAGAVVMLDGQPLGGFAPIGSSGFEVARVTLPNGADGNHEISADQKFGITVYGYGQYTSYWYPGGLDLTDIPVP